jgi:tellurium resistance protein TerZ
VRHTGDNLTGAGDGDDESVIVDLTRLSPAVAQIVFTVNSFDNPAEPGQRVS